MDICNKKVLVPMYSLDMISQVTFTARSETKSTGCNMTKSALPKIQIRKVKINASINHERC
jgi:hypothetical protein